MVLDADLRQALVAIRSLGRRGLRVAALGQRHRAPALASRYCLQGLVSRETPASARSLEALEQALGDTCARVLIPSADATVALLRRHRKRLEERVRIPLAADEALGIAIDKQASLAVAVRLGIAVPRGVVVCSLDDVPAALAEVGLPAVAKPTESWQQDHRGGARLDARLVITAAEARSAVAGLTRFRGRVLLQEYLPGRREAVSLFSSGGAIRARFAQWAQRTSPPIGGESVLRQSIALPDDLGWAAERLVGEIGLDGYAEVEFRRDAAGVPRLMEINPRLSASVELAVRSGVDFPALLYRWAIGDPIAEVKGYKVGAWMRYLRGDLMTTVAALRQRGRPGVAPPWRALLGFAASFLRPMSYDYLDWQDPSPALRAAANFAGEALHAATRARPWLLARRCGWR
jgi:predicted ATP-grasp superfamily ATP-dependent carboligase